MTLDQSTFDNALPKLINKFLTKFQQINDDQQSTVTSRILFFVCKSMLETANGLKAQVHYNEEHFDKMKMFFVLFKSYVCFIGSECFRSETLEGLRRVTHDALQSHAEMRWKSSEERVNTDMDFPEYNNLISNCLRSVPVKYFKEDSEQILTTLHHVVSYIKETSDESTAISKHFENLLISMRDFQFEWFIRLPSSDERDLLLRTQFIIPVDNRWKGTEHQCFQMMDQKGFIKVYEALYNSNEIPKHYQFHVIRVLLQQVDKLAKKQTWLRGKRISRRDQLEAMAGLIMTISTSILYFREQPDYVSFDEFQQNSIGSVLIAVEQSRSLDDFRNRIGLIRNIRSRTLFNLNATDIDEALNIICFHPSTHKTSRIYLRQAYSRYLTTFNQRIMLCGAGTRKERIQEICKRILLSNTPMLKSSWYTPGIKQTYLPNILASLSAVWSLVVSKNVSSFESLEKPTCLQMCYVFLYLMEPSSQQLIQLSATQGKMLVLGLITSFLAVCGYNVQIVCYNGSLFRRNATDLLKLFELLSLASKISFGTVEDLAREQSEIIYHNYARYIHQCLDIPFSDTSMSQTQHSLESTKSILIIEETDLFLLKKRFLKYFVRFVMPIVPGLAIVQEKIYSSDKKITIEEIEEFIEKSDLPQMAELRAFLDKPKTYKINQGNNPRPREWSNKSLFLSHLKTMLENVELPKDCYQVTSEGEFKACLSNPEDILCYKTTAAYFRLKKNNWQKIAKEQKNYGCLQAFALPLFYENLLSVDMSLGFQSACYLNQHERYMRSPYIDWQDSLTCPRDLCPTKFDPTQDFLSVESELDWMISIMTAIHTAIERRESVLVFFNSEVELHRFQKEFASQLKRFTVTAIETSSNGTGPGKNEPLLDEVTILVIDDVDSIAEERDTHVIQTFCSVDAREENLIRKQAERKHSNGNYELILCIPHSAVGEGSRR